MNTDEQFDIAEDDAKRMIDCWEDLQVALTKYNQARAQSLKNFWRLCDGRKKHFIHGNCVVEFDPKNRNLENFASINYYDYLKES